MWWNEISLKKHFPPQKVDQNFSLQTSGNVWQNPLILEIGVNKMQKFATEKKKNTDCKH
jgi:hypothetical protein